MKKVILAVAIISVALLAAPMQAQTDKCTLGSVDVLNDFTSEGITHSKVTWKFSCRDAAADSGQITKMLYKIPLADVRSLEVSDAFGTMKVLEGPAYFSADTTEKGTTIGVIFRKGLLITDKNTSYSTIVEFESASLVLAGGNSTFSISPEKTVSSPKVTIVSTGITETTYQIASVNYELELPQDASIKQLTQGCTVSSGRVICNNLNIDEFKILKVEWALPEKPPGILGSLKKFLPDLMPKITNIFKGVSDRLSGLIKGKK